MHACWLVREHGRRHIEDTPAVETDHEWIARAIRTEAALNAALGARVNRIHLREVISTLQELHSVHDGTHPDIDQNQTLTINNVPKMLEDIHIAISNQIAELLQSAEPLTRAEDKVMAWTHS